MHVVSTNFAKTLVANVNITSYCDVTKSVYPVTMTTTHHCSILEFGRGASNEAVAPGITRPLHAPDNGEYALGERSPFETKLFERKCLSHIDFTNVVILPTFQFHIAAEILE